MCVAASPERCLRRVVERFAIEVVDVNTKDCVGRFDLAPSQLLPIVIAPVLVSSPQNEGSVEPVSTTSGGG
jgi:hypothetical protein